MTGAWSPPTLAEFTTAKPTALRGSDIDHEDLHAAGCPSGAHRAAMNGTGSTALREVWSPRCTSKRRCGPEEFPDDPTRPRT
jgi:hypothetical protein